MIDPVKSISTQAGYHYHSYYDSYLSIGRHIYVPPADSYTNSYLSTIAQLNAGEKVGVTLQTLNGTSTIVGNTENFFQITRMD